jgi:solute carrier family 25 protein 33/36
MSGAVLTAPLDVVKTRLQSDFYKERLQAAKAVGTARSRFGVWRHLSETGVILRYHSGERLVCC